MLLEFFLKIAGSYVRMSYQSISGQKLLTPPELLERINADIGLGAIGPRPYLAGFHFPPQVLGDNFAILGMTGSGKSIIIDSLVNSILPKWIGGSSRFRAVLYDAKCTATPQLAAMGITVENGKLVITNPFDKRCSGWQTGKDVTDKVAAMQLAELLIPNDRSNGADAYWVDTARLAVAAVAVSLIKTLGTRWTLRDLFIPLVCDQRKLPGVLAMSPENEGLFFNIYHDTKHSAGILSELRRMLSELLPIVEFWEQSPRRFSLVDFMNSSAVLSLGVFYQGTRAVEKINRLLFTRLVDLVCAKPAISNDLKQADRTIFILDELPQMGKLPQLNRLLTYPRAMGGSAILGLQSLVSLEAIYEGEVYAILGNCKNIVQLGSNCTRSLDWSSDLFGTQEVVYTSNQENTSHQAASDSRGGSGGVSRSYGNSQHREVRKVVNPSEIGSLRPASPTNGITGYVKTSYGGYRANLNWNAVLRMLPVPVANVPGLLQQQNLMPGLAPWTEEESRIYEAGFARVAEWMS